jgi:hypothetical protein
MAQASFSSERTIEETYIEVKKATDHGMELKVLARAGFQAAPLQHSGMLRFLSEPCRLEIGDTAGWDTCATIFMTDANNRSAADALSDLIPVYQIT